MTEPKTLFHRNDPDTSRDAAEKMVKSGGLSMQEHEVWDIIFRYTNTNRYPFYFFTARELADWSGFDYYTIQRRMSGLKDKGKVERIQIDFDLTLGKPIFLKRNGQCVWRAI